MRLRPLAKIPRAEPVKHGGARYQQGRRKRAAGGAVAVILAFLVGGCAPPPDVERRPDRSAASEWQQELGERRAAIERTRDAGQRAQRTPAPPSTSPSDWQMINFVDEFGDRTGQGAMSRDVGPLRPMSFPYGSTTARIFVNCDRAWVRFNESPNLNGGDIRDGYTRYTVAVRVDGNDARWAVNQSWGDDDLRFVDSSRAIAALSGGSTFDLAVSWFGEGAVAFSWSLAGSSDAIQRSCD